MSAPAPQPSPEQGADWFKVQSWMVGEIVLAHQILGRKINELRKQNEARTAVGQKLAAEEVVRLAEQLKVCADIIVRKSTEFLNRRSR